MSGPSPTPTAILEQRGSWRAKTRPNEPKSGQGGAGGPAARWPLCGSVRRTRLPIPRTGARRLRGHGLAICSTVGVGEYLCQQGLRRDGEGDGPRRSGVQHHGEALPVAPKLALGSFFDAIRMKSTNAVFRPRSVKRTAALV